MPSDRMTTCACHERMGNDFYFLPHGNCLYFKTCQQEQTMAQLIERAAAVPRSVERDPIRGGRLT